MMAPLKFRAWYNGKMYDSIRYENICGKNYIGGCLDGMMDISYEVDGESTIIMQWTGLRDENGVEIYEGDIIKEGYYEKYGRRVVEWKGDGFNLMIGGDNSWEVIGNVWQNSELLQ